jgi:DNA repair exonuclease SbcCD nuclease subunit
MRLAHLADVHAGHRQYGLIQRSDDMIATLRHTLDEIGNHDVKAVLLPGDLFHSRDLRPKTLDRVETALRECVPSDVPVLVTQGNHDENLSPRDVTWLSYLHRRGHIVLLEADLSGGSETPAGFEPFNPGEPGTHAGFIDVPTDRSDGPVRVFGLQWRGARTADALKAVAEGIRTINESYDTPAYTVLLGHFGMEDELPALGGTVTHADLREIRSVVDYLALGHLHKRYDAADWIYNPGSPEAHNTREARDDWEHGYYIVDLEPDEGTDGLGTLAHEPRHHRTKRRPYYRIEFDVTPHESPGELETAFRERIDAETDAIEAHCRADIHTGSGGSRRPPLIDLRFSGTLQFARSEFRIRTGELAEWVERACDALYVQMSVGVRHADVQALLADLDGEEVFVDGKLNTSVLERQVFETIAAESEYGEHADDVADVLERAHTMTQSGEDVEDVVGVLSDRRRDLFPGMAKDATIEISEDPLANKANEPDGQGDRGRASEVGESHPDAVTAESGASDSAEQNPATNTQPGEIVNAEERRGETE